MRLTLDRLSKHFKNKIAVDQVSAELVPGVYGFLGANGAGKTTLMQMICGIIAPTSGEVLLNGENNVLMGERFRDLLGYLPQEFGYTPGFSAKDFMLYVASIKGLDPRFARRKTNELLSLVNLEDAANQKIRTFSGGMKRRLGIAQDLLNDPVVAPYFKPLNETVVNMTASKVIPGFILILVIIGVTWALTKWKGSTPAKAAVLAIAAGIELFFIDGAFIQNVQANEYLQPKNPVVSAFKAPYKTDSLNTPRVLSLSRNKALGANAFPQYHLRNADGFHDNELATYREFRGGQQNANYLLNINNPEAAHPFLDLMNIGAIIFDSRQGTTFMPIQTAMGEAYIYGQSVTMDDASAIKTLREKAAIRKPKVEESAPVAAEDSTAAASDSTATETAAAEPEQTAEAAQPKAEPEDDSFYYRETVILSEKPEHEGEGGIANGYAKLVASPKMDTQVFEVESDRAGFMVVAGNYHPYWNATVNGAPAKVYKAFGTLRAVEIPKGKSEVRMEYRSKPLHACIKVSAFAAILLIALGVFAAYRRKKS